MVRVARHGSLRSEVYRKLREQILNGRYRRGTALTESQISLEMGVSRTPVREAIGQLVLDGLVRATPNKSVIVQGFDDQDMLDLYEVRGIMETLAAGRAAIMMTDEQRQALRAVLEQERQYTGDGDSIEILQNMDSLFHDLIFQGTGSKILQNILSPINIYTRHARSVSLATPGRSQQVVEEHARILSAIEERDSVAARELMRTHIARASASFLAVRRKGGSQHA
jgi:DNA-binding GntR family transcriptional regulator